MVSAAEVTIEVGHQLGRVTPADAVRPLLDRLSYGANEFRAVGALGYRRVRMRRLMHRRDGAGGVTFPAGLTDQVASWLRATGHAVRLIDRRAFDGKATPCAGRLAAAGAAERGPLEAVAGEPRGLIRVTSARQAVRVIALVCGLFPAARILVVRNARRDQLRALRRDLQAAAGVPFHGVQDYDWPFVGGRLVGTLADFRLTSPADFDVLILADALQGLAPANATPFARWEWHRVYGVLAGGMPAAAATRLRLQAMFGPALFSVSDPRGENILACVRWVTPPVTEPPGEVSPLERKRSCFWHNGLRNDQVAAVATALAAADEAALWRHGLFLGETAGAVERAATVAVAVESSEHARALLRRLPGWRMVSATPPDNGPPVANPWDWPSLHRAVVTLAAASQLGDFSTDVLIWAGMEYEPVLTVFPPEVTPSGRTATLIDFADDFDAAARAAVARRAHAYEARGWQVIATPSWASDRRQRSPAGRRADPDGSSGTW
jgi:hypothetical protein